MPCKINGFRNFEFLIENDHYKTLLPEYYLRPYSPHYISENDFDNELKQIDNSIRRLLNEIS